MPKFTIRPARSEDASAIAKVHIQAWQETYFYHSKISFKTMEQKLLQTVYQIDTIMVPWLFQGTMRT